MSRGRLAEWVNSNLSFRDEYRTIFGREAPYGNCACPWHQTGVVNTPAAKIYDNRLKCFGQCGRSYSVFDLLCRFNPERLRSISASGVIPEAVLSTTGIDTQESFTFCRREDVPDTLVVGTFEFFEYLTL